MTRRTLSVAAVSLLLSTASIAVLATAAQAAGWDADKAHAECRDFKTDGMAEDGVYGPWFQAMYKHYGWTDCHRTDNDIGSAEVIAAYEAEKNNPQAVVADIGIAFGPVAAAKGLTLKYVPTGSDFVPAAYKEPGGGWIGSVVGAVGFTVNLEAVPEAPQSWADLQKPEFKGKVKGPSPASGGTGFMTVLAANQALGGTPQDLSKAYAYFKSLRDNGNWYNGPCDFPDLERGACAIKIQYDFYGLAENVMPLKKKGVKAAFILPKDGTIWAPSALLPNGSTDKPDLAKAILDFAMTEDAALAWAQTYAHPMKAVFGGYKLPADVTKDWPSAADYSSAAALQSFPEVGKVAAEWEATVLK
jgi:putative spermidine/putrescine transport system substrate-binding protein